MSTPKIQKLINFYNDKSIGDSERAVAASKLIPLLIEQGNWTKPVSGSHGEDLAILNVNYPPTQSDGVGFKPKNECT